MELWTCLFWQLSLLLEALLPSVNMIILPRHGILRFSVKLGRRFLVSRVLFLSCLPAYTSTQGYIAVLPNIE